MDLAELWRQAQVVEPLEFDYEELASSVGAFCLHTGAPAILSLDPAEDFELNTDIIMSWKLVFQKPNGEVISDLPYDVALQALKNHTLDQQNGSVLIRALTAEETQEIIAKAIFD